MYIKYILVLFSFFVFFSQNLFAEIKVTDKNAVKALIEKVKKVAPSQRRVLMNELKIKLRSMHQETRKQVMLDLRSSFNQHTSNNNAGIKSNMNHQSTMSMTESKNMKEHMHRDSNLEQRPPGKRPPSNTPKRGM